MRDSGLRDPDIRGLLERMASEAPLEPVGTDGAVRKARRRIAIVWVSVFVVAALAFGAVAVVLEHVDEAWVPAPASPGPPFAASDLSSIVLSEPDDVAKVLGDAGMPGRLVMRGTQHANVVTVESFTQVSRTDLASAGMEDAFLAWYLTPRFDDGAGGTSLVSLAMWFPDASGADLGLAAFLEGGENAWRVWRPGTTDGLGDEAYLIDGRLNMVPTLAIVWRTGNLLLFLASEGRFTPEGFRALSDEMQRRARSVA